MALAKLERHLEEAIVDRKQLGGVVIAAASKDGTVDYLKALGPISFDAGAAPITPDAVFSLASCTKLIVSVAALQCVERGLITLDTDIADILPEWRHPQVLTHIDSDGKPCLQPAATPITLAHLLTHTSGIASWDNKKIKQYFEASENSDKLKIVGQFFTADYPTQLQLLPQLHDLLDSLEVMPLVFEPGTSWVYGHGLDWAARIIETLNGVSLEEYCRQNIFHPLGMDTATFRLGDHPDITERLVPCYARCGDGSFSPFPRMFPPKPKVERGSGGACCSAEDFMKLLKSLLREDGIILKSNSIDLLLGYRLPDRTIMKKEEEKALAFPSHIRLDHSLAGMVNLDKVSEFSRSPGSSFWSGASSTYWWIDPAAGICGFYGSAIMMMGDQGISEQMFKDFEKAVYEEYKQKSNL